MDRAVVAKRESLYKPMYRTEEGHRRLGGKYYEIQ